MSSDKTLATAKHGGCVQLPTSERVKFDAWLEARSVDTTRWGDGEYTDPAAHNYWLAWQAALSAQPSPGGQGEALGKCNECGRRTFHNYPQGDICLHCNLTAGEGRSTESVALDALVAAGHVDQVTADRALKVAAALAARQPGEGKWHSPLAKVAEAYCVTGTWEQIADAVIAARQPVGEPVDDDAASEAFGEFADDYLTDGNGYAPASTYAACSKAFTAAWPDRVAATAAARAELRRLHGDDRTVGARRAEALNRADARNDAEDDAAPPAQAVDLGARPIETAPRDGTMVRLLVLFEEHATEDTAESAWTIGVCNDDHVGEDQRIGWQFAGWCWTHDHFTEGKGTPVGWLPLIDSQAVGNGQPGVQA